MNRIGHGLDQGIEKRADRHCISPLDQLGSGELGRPVDRHEQVEFAVFRPDLGNVEVKMANRVDFELLPVGLVARDIRQPGDTKASRTFLP